MNIFISEYIFSRFVGKSELDLNASSLFYLSLFTVLLFRILIAF